MRCVIGACFGAIVAVRISWFADYIRLSLKNHDGWSGTMRRLITDMADVPITSPEREEYHKAAIETTRRQYDIAVLGGTIAITAWTALYVGAVTTPSVHLSGLSLTLMFTGGLILIAGPFFGRTEGRQVTYIVRESAVNVGFCSLLLALFSIAIDLAPSGARWLLLAAALIVTARELADSITMIRFQRGDFADLAAVEKVAASASDADGPGA